ncbi:MAG: 6-bladed beta-propeller [Acidimicrobiia bacterium]|nr:6-bladed beta-propeller [Acidimicrobiia bacterium]
MIRLTGPLLATLVLVSGGLGLAQAPQPIPEYVSGPYNVDPDWPRPISPDLTWGRTPAVFAESPDRVFVMQSGLVPWTWKRTESDIGGFVPQVRAANIATHCEASQVPDGTCEKTGQLMVEQRTGSPVLGGRWDHVLMIVNAAGEIVESWDQHNHLFTHPHSIAINPYDPERHVWVVDDDSEQIFKFTRGGRLVMTIGEFRVPGSDRTHLGGPSGITWLPNGDFYVTDGYKNSRVVKFAADGTYLMEFGSRGTGPGQFRTPHGLAIDARGRLYIADRSNDRIQVFDANGTFLQEWPNIGMPNYVAISADQQHAWVADGRNNKILKYDLAGNLLDAWGTFGFGPGQIWCVHSFSTDSAGNFYTAEVFSGRAQKFRPKPGVDPARLVGPLLVNQLR